ncbi:MAG: twin-arginine translocase TatA/TatE family subunit [Alphaproteobacteria bacterium]|nr:twin-arginine translocase TatA/TatE family subunit [Alphaproteobacteria bacterium]
MFDFSLAEILLIVVVAVVFIGPKDMPVAIRAVARGLAQLRGFAREMKQAFDDVARESGLHEAHDGFQKEVKMITGDDGRQYEAYDISHLSPPQNPPHEPE